MADTRLMCKHCGEETDHMHLAGKVCICSICGEGNDAKNWRDIQAAVEKRQKDNQAEVARRVPGIETDQELTAVAKLPYSERGFREPSRNTKPKEKPMKSTKLTDEKIAEIRADYAALPEDKRDYAARVALAKKHGVSAPTIGKYVSLMEPKARPAKKPSAPAKPGRKAASPAPKAAEGPAQASGGGLRALIERVVDERINVRLADLGLETLDSKVSAMVKAELVEALK